MMIIIATQLYFTNHKRKFCNLMMLLLEFFFYSQGNLHFYANYANLYNVYNHIKTFR